MFNFVCGLTAYWLERLTRNQQVPGLVLTLTHFAAECGSGQDDHAHVPLS